jgi:hypothetical protein
MSFTRAVPANVAELKSYLDQIAASKSHVKSVVVNTNTDHLEIALDWAAHLAQKPDVYLPLKKAKINDAKNLVTHMMGEVEGGFPVSDAEVQELYDMIDPSQK